MVNYISTALTCVFIVAVIFFSVADRREKYSDFDMPKYDGDTYSEESGYDAGYFDSGFDFTDVSIGGKE